MMHIMSCSDIVLTDCRCRCVIRDKQKLEAILINLMNAFLMELALVLLLMLHGRRMIAH